MKSNVASENGKAVLLKTDKAPIRFGGLVAVNELAMAVRSHEGYGLIGPHGAGKTTIFNLLTGVYRPTSGAIHFKDKRIDGMRPYEIAGRGVSRTFQNIRLFPSMTVLENVMTACHIHMGQTCWMQVLRRPFNRDEEKIATHSLNSGLFEDRFKTRRTSLPWSSSSAEFAALAHPTHLLLLTIRRGDDPL